MTKAFLLALPFTLVLGAGAAHAAEPSKPVACIYGGVAHNRLIDKDKLYALVENGMAAKTGDDKDIQGLIGRQVTNCKNRFGWSPPRQQDAVRYLQARLLYDAQDNVLKQYGISYEMLGTVVAGLAPEARQAYVNGQVTGEIISDAVTKFNAAGATIGDPAKANRDTLIAIDKAIVSTITEADAETAYNAR